MSPSGRTDPLDDISLSQTTEGLSNAPPRKSCHILENGYGDATTLRNEIDDFCIRCVQATFRAIFQATFWVTFQVAAVVRSAASVIREKSASPGKRFIVTM